MYVLINTMSAADNITIGHVISSHYTLEAAEKADNTMQRQIRKASPGLHTHIPTRIVELKRRPRLGQQVDETDVIE